MVDPTDDGDRVKLTPSQVGTLHDAYAILGKIEDHADDGSQDFADHTMRQFSDVLECYPIKEVDPKPQKPKTDTGASSQ